MLPVLLAMLLPITKIFCGVDMTDKQTGGPAFPGTQYAVGISPTGHATGMTLRDYFAAKAMQALLSTELIEQRNRFAEEAYAMADAMLKVREA